MRLSPKLVALGVLVFLGVWAIGRAGERSERQAYWLFYDSLSTTGPRIAQEIVQHGGRVRVQSEWLHAVSARISLREAQRIHGVVHVQPVGKVYAASSPSSSPLALQQQDSASYGPNYAALRELGIPQAHTLGLTGNNVRIGILDTGFEPSHEAFARARVIAQRDFINNDANVANEPSDREQPARDQELHGTWVWSILGGNRTGQIIGPAYDAQFILAKVDIEQIGEDFAADEDRWIQAIEWATTQQGARIINSSLGYRDFLDKPDYTQATLNGSVAISTLAARAAARRGVLVVTAVGNLGPAPGSLVAPADADSTISVGAVDALGQVVNGSSRGPTGDGRFKPELVARGVNIYAANARLANGYETVSFGTSLSTPLVAGGAAQFIQAWPNLSTFAVRSALLLSGSQSQFPDNNRGYGLPNIANAIVFPEGILPNGVATLDASNTTLTTIAPTFNWRVPLVLPNARPTYRLELSSDVTFTNIFYTDTTSTAFSLMVRRPLTPLPTLWWRVIGEVVPGIRRSSPISGPITMPDWVRLTVLNDTRPQFVNTLRPTFSWDPLTAPAPIGPLIYDVQVISTNGQIVQTVPNVTTASVTLPQPLAPNLAYRWRVIAKSQVGVADTVESRGSFVATSSTSPPATLLYPPFPNPFPRPEQSSRETRFWFDLNARAEVEFAIYDLRGRLIRQLIPATPSCGAQTLDPGQYGRADAQNACWLLGWDGLDRDGNRAARGVYLARLRAGGQVSTQRILFIPSN